MANARRGEVDATVAGRPFTLCLTLGSLAELEAAFALDDLGALAERFAAGRLGARDLARLFAAGARGGGHSVTEAEILAWPAATLGEVVSAVAALLAATFGDAPPNPPGPQAA
ncbi:MAG: gene transfer agent family protein [Methylobacteriaceae bacterium]|nr:gene transfer agent family protein [Methylobacteriaceae bacterium]